jgi:hypothetical protein
MSAEKIRCWLDHNSAIQHCAWLVLSGEAQVLKSPQPLGGALLLRLLGLRSSGRFLDRRVCGLSLFALAFQAQFDEVLPKLAVVHDSILQLGELHSGMFSNGAGRITP